MKSVWRALIWKEWHEHKWKIAALTAVLVVPPLSYLGSNFQSDVVLILTPQLFAYPLLAALFIGADTGASEQSNRTIGFLRSSPLPLWKVAATKLLCGWLTLVIPIAFGCVLALYWAYLSKVPLEYVMEWAYAQFTGDIANPLHGRGSLRSRPLPVALIVLTSIYLWTAAIGVNRESIVRASSLTLLVITLSGGFLFWFHSKAVHSEILLAVYAILLSIAPAGIVFGPWTEPGGETLVLVMTVVATIVHVFLGWWYLKRFGHISELPIRSPQVAKAKADTIVWLALPRRTSISAIAWKQFRESVPIVLTGIGGSIATSLILIAVNQVPESEMHLWLIAPTALVGLFVAIVVGVGVFYADLDSQRNFFWRSIPIRPTTFFWTKVITASSIFFLAFSLPYLLVLLLANLDLLTRHPELEGIQPIMLASLFGFSIALLAITLLRNAVYSALIAFGATVLALSAMEAYFRTNYQFIVIVGLGSIPLLATLFAWLAVRYDWSLRR